MGRGSFRSAPRAKPARRRDARAIAAGLELELRSETRRLRRAAAFATGTQRSPSRRCSSTFAPGDGGRTVPGDRARARASRARAAQPAPSAPVRRPSPRSAGSSPGAVRRTTCEKLAAGAAIVCQTPCDLLLELDALDALRLAGQRERPVRRRPAPPGRVSESVPRPVTQVERSPSARRRSAPLTVAVSPADRRHEDAAHAAGRACG